MELISGICSVIVAIASVAILVLGIAWVIMAVKKKEGRKKTGRRLLIALGCFAVFTLVGSLSDPSAHDGTWAVKKENGGETVESGMLNEDSAQPDTEESIVYGGDVRRFARKNKVSEAFAQSLKDAIGETEYADRFSELWLDPIEDWALGLRYRAWCGSDDDYIALTVYELKDAVESVYDVSDGAKVLVYQAENEPPEDVEQPDNGGIRIVDGVLGEYGKNVTIPSETFGEYTYAWYTVPYGTYEIQNELKTATIFVVDDADSENVSDVIRFSEKGESQRVTIGAGYHIELSEGTEILLLPLK